ncbi:MAG: hypothetical protein ACTHN5_03135 [Phycisphaerae bacterium]
MTVNEIVGMVEPPEHGRGGPSSLAMAVGEEEETANEPERDHGGKYEVGKKLPKHKTPCELELIFRRFKATGPAREMPACASLH